jgi:hypothetical protein
MPAPISGEENCDSHFRCGRRRTCSAMHTSVHKHENVTIARALRQRGSRVYWIQKGRMRVTRCRNSADAGGLHALEGIVSTIICCWPTREVETFSLQCAMPANGKWWLGDTLNPYAQNREQTRHRRGWSFRDKADMMMYCIHRAECSR